MPKSAWTIDTKWLDDIARDVRDGAQRICEEAASQALEVAREAAPSDSGALKASGYVKTRRKSGYAAAVTAAHNADGTRVGERGQIENEMDAPSTQALPSAQTTWAAFHFPVTYADLQRFGYYHAGAQRQIPGNDFVQAGLNAVDIEAAAQRVLRDAMRKHLEK